MKQPNFKVAKFPVPKKDYAKVEKQKNISINVFGNEDKIPYRIYTSRQTFGKHVGLLLLSNFKKCHCVLIKVFNRFVTIKQNITTKTFLLILVTMLSYFKSIRMPCKKLSCN